MQQQRPDSPGPGSGPGPSCVTMKSDWSMDHHFAFKGEPAAGGRMQQQRPDSPGPGPRPGPGPSCVSMKSDWSMDHPFAFKGEPAAGGRMQQQRPDSPGPGPSCVSMKSDWSMDHPFAFKGLPAAGGRVQQISEVQVPQQLQTDMDCVFLLLEGNIITFVKDELKKIQKVLSPGYPECLESEGEDEEQRSSREAFVKITLDFLRRMKQEDLADYLQISKRI